MTIVDKVHVVKRGYECGGTIADKSQLEGGTLGTWLTSHLSKGTSEAVYDILDCQILGQKITILDKVHVVKRGMNVVAQLPTNHG